MPRELSKCRQWEKERRGRLNECFNKLSKLLPCYDASTNISKIDILIKSTVYINELETKVKNSLTSNSENKPECEEIKQLYIRIKDLLGRNEQLCKLLRDAGISIPAERVTAKFDVLKKWSQKISPQKAEVLAKHESQKENKPKQVKSKTISKKTKAGSASKAKSIIKTKPIVRKKTKIKKNTANTPNNGIIVKPANQSSITTSITSSIQPCYFISNNTLVANKGNTNNSVVTNTSVLRAPILSASLKTQASTFPTGTLIFTNNIPLVQPQAILNPILVKAPAPSTVILLNQSQNQNKNVVTNINETLMKSEATLKNLPVIRPKRIVTNTTHINKLPIPASRYATNYIIVPQNSPTSVPTVTKKVISSKKVVKVKRKRKAVQNIVETTVKKAKIERNTKSINKPPTSNYSIDEICKNNVTTDTSENIEKLVEICKPDETSNDIFESLQVPLGSQNPESTSPTAAFLNAFPLVSSFTGVKVNEVIENDSPEGSPTLLQIGGTMDATKVTNSENFTSTLMNLENLSFLSGKEIARGVFTQLDNEKITPQVARKVETSHELRKSSKVILDNKEDEVIRDLTKNSLTKLGVSKNRISLISEVKITKNQFIPIVYSSTSANLQGGDSISDKTNFTTRKTLDNVFESNSSVAQELDNVNPILSTSKSPEQKVCTGVIMSSVTTKADNPHSLIPNMVTGGLTQINSPAIYTKLSPPNQVMITNIPITLVSSITENYSSVMTTKSYPVITTNVSTLYVPEISNTNPSVETANINSSLTNRKLELGNQFIGTNVTVPSVTEIYSSVMTNKISQVNSFMPANNVASEISNSISSEEANALGTTSKLSLNNQFTTSNELVNVNSNNFSRKLNKSIMVTTVPSSAVDMNLICPKPTTEEPNAILNHTSNTKLPLYRMRVTSDINQITNLGNSVTPSTTKETSSSTFKKNIPEAPITTHLSTPMNYNLNLSLTSSSSSCTSITYTTLSSTNKMLPLTSTLASNSCAPLSSIDTISVSTLPTFNKLSNSTDFNYTTLSSINNLSSSYILNYTRSSTNNSSACSYSASLPSSYVIPPVSSLNFNTKTIPMSTTVNTASINNLFTSLPPITSISTQNTLFSTLPPVSTIPNSNLPRKVLETVPNTITSVNPSITSSIATTITNNSVSSTYFSYNSSSTYKLPVMTTNIYSNLLNTSSMYNSTADNNSYSISNISNNKYSSNEYTSTDTFNTSNSNSYTIPNISNKYVPSTTNEFPSITSTASFNISGGLIITNSNPSIGNKFSPHTTNYLSIPISSSVSFDTSSASIISNSNISNKYVPSATNYISIASSNEYPTIISTTSFNTSSASVITNSNPNKYVPPSTKYVTKSSSNIMTTAPFTSTSVITNSNLNLGNKYVPSTTKYNLVPSSNEYPTIVSTSSFNTSLASVITNSNPNICRKYVPSTTNYVPIASTNEYLTVMSTSSFNTSSSSTITNASNKYVPSTTNYTSTGNSNEYPTIMSTASFNTSIASVITNSNPNIGNKYVPSTTNYISIASSNEYPTIMSTASFNPSSASTITNNSNKYTPITTNYTPVANSDYLIVNTSSTLTSNAYSIPNFVPPTTNYTSIANSNEYTRIPSSVPFNSTGAPIITNTISNKYLPVTTSYTPRSNEYTSITGSVTFNTSTPSIITSTNSYTIPNMSNKYPTTTSNYTPIPSSNAYTSKVSTSTFNSSHNNSYTIPNITNKYLPTASNYTSVPSSKYTSITSTSNTIITTNTPTFINNSNIFCANESSIKPFIKNVDATTSNTYEVVKTTTTNNIFCPNETMIKTFVKPPDVTNSYESMKTTLTTVHVTTSNKYQSNNMFYSNITPGSQLNYNVDANKKPPQNEKTSCSRYTNLNYQTSEYNTFNPFTDLPKTTNCNYTGVKNYNQPVYTNNSNYTYQDYSAGVKNLGKPDKSYYNYENYDNMQYNYYNQEKVNKNKEPRAPVNWMTTPDVKLHDFNLPPFKEADLANIYSHQNFSSNTPTTYFGPAGPTDFPNNSFSDVKKLDVQFANFPRDIEENQFNWSPTKAPVLDTSHNFVSTTLPTLVGDLALNTNTNAANTNLAQFSEKSKINKTRDRRGYDTGTNFLSVSQLVDHNQHNKTETIGRISSRRNSGGRSKSTKGNKRNSGGNKGENKEELIVSPKIKNYNVHNLEYRVKNPPSSYSAEALIGIPTQTTNVTKKQQNYTKAGIVPPFLPHDNLITYFPPVDLPPDNNFNQQNQNYQNNYNFPSSIQNNTYSSYLPTTNFIPDIPEYNTMLTDNFFNNPKSVDNKSMKKTTLKREQVFPNKKSSSKKIKGNAEASSSASFVDFSFLSMPGTINSPILPDDFHAHSNFLPPPLNPINSTQLYSCKNPLYAKQGDLSSSLLSLPPVSRAPIQHPEISPSLNNAGTSLTNFNLSTIFPEITKTSEMFLEPVVKNEVVQRTQPATNEVPAFSKSGINLDNPTIFK